MPNQDAAPARERSFRAELTDAVTPRTALLVIGVLLLGLGFTLSYVGALHNPKPHKVALDVVAPPPAVQQTVASLNALPGQPFKAKAVADEPTARRRIAHRQTDAAFVVVGGGVDDQLLVAGAGGPTLAQAVQQVLGAVELQQGRSLTVVDVQPVGGTDRGGLASFYLAVGWVVGGYLAAAILAISVGARPANHRRALLRLLTLGLYSAVAGIGGALIATHILGALPGHMWRLALFGALVVFGTGAATLAFQALFGVVGIGVAILLFVILGNPSAGGPYPGPLLPTFWRAIGPWLPPGAATSGIRGIEYFARAGTGQPIWALVGYALIGAAITYLLAGRKMPWDTQSETTPVSTAVGA